MTTASFSTERPAKGGLVAFLGPSLSAKNAQRIAPDVQIWPPIRQSDLTTAIERCAPRAVLIVDGEFGQSLSVWHKEILHALQDGVRVIGCSSMGALRASELDRYGMEGVGEIYEYFRDGGLTADEDVALVYGRFDDEWVSHTWPTVNIRATVRDLVARDQWSTNDGDAVLAAAQSLHFSDRAGPPLVSALAVAGLPPDRAKALVAEFKAGYVDQKRRDAEAGFRYLAEVDAITPPARHPAAFPNGRGMQALRYCDTSVERRHGGLRRNQIVQDAALHVADFDELCDRAADRYIALETARDLGMTADAEQLAAERMRFLRRLGLTEEALENWLASADLRAVDFDQLMAEQALVRRLRRHTADLRFYERNRRMVIEQLQIEGRYAAVADAAARRRSALATLPTPRVPFDPDEVMDLVRRQISSGWRPVTDLGTLADDQGFDGFVGLVGALADADAASAELDRRRRRMAVVLGLDETTGAAVVPSTSYPTQGPVVSAPMLSDGARMHSMLEAHQVTQILLAAVELGVPDKLAQGVHGTAELATAIGADRERLERLLVALSTLGVTEKHNGGWALTGLGAALAPETHDSFDPYAKDLRHRIMPRWASLADAIRDGSTPEYPSDPIGEDAIASATGAIGLDRAVAASLTLVPGMHVVDLGGGIGRVLETLHEREPAARYTLVELAPSAERARKRFAGLGLADIAVVDSPVVNGLGCDADVCVIVRVIVTLDDKPAAELLRVAGSLVGAQGSVEVFDIHHDGSTVAATADLLNLVRSGGRVRTAERWQQLAADAGMRIIATVAVAAPFVRMTMVAKSWQL